MKKIIVSLVMLVIGIIVGASIVNVRANDDIVIEKADKPSEILIYTLSVDNSDPSRPLSSVSIKPEEEGFLPPYDFNGYIAIEDGMLVGVPGDNYWFWGWNGIITDKHPRPIESDVYTIKGHFLRKSLPVGGVEFEKAKVEPTPAIPAKKIKSETKPSKCTCK